MGFSGLASGFSFIMFLKFLDTHTRIRGSVAKKYGIMGLKIGPEMIQLEVKFSFR